MSFFTNGDYVNSRAIVVSDIDGDGLDDALFTVSSNNSGIFAYNRHGEAIEGWPLQLYLENISYPRHVYTAPTPVNIDDDPGMEVLGVFLAGNDAYGLVLADHDGTVLWEKVFYAGYFAPEIQASVGDINGDNQPDILLNTGVIESELVTAGDPGTSNGIFAFTMEGEPIDLDSDESLSYLLIEGSYSQSHVVIDDIDQNDKVDLITLGTYDAAFQEDGNYVLKNRHSIYVWEMESSYNPSNVLWPMYRGDVGRTGRYRVTEEPSGNEDASNLYVHQSEIVAGNHQLLAGELGDCSAATGG